MVRGSVRLPGDEAFRTVVRCWPEGMNASSGCDSAPMLAAFGALAYAASMLTHEALGHGSYCLAVGGHNTLITAWWETCRFPGAPRLGIKAAGPAVQFAAGLLSWLVLHAIPRNATRLRWFLWLYMMFNLLISSSYVAFSSVTGSGDAAEFVAPLHAAPVWRVVIVVVGVTVYFLALRAGAYELRALARGDDSMHRLFRAVWIPYVSAGVLACCTVAVLQTLEHGAASGLATASPGLNRIAGPVGLAIASSFGAASGMFAMPGMQSSARAELASHAAYLQWSRAWGLVAGTLLVLFLVYAGPGIR